MSSQQPVHPEIERYIDAMWMEKGLSDNTLSSYRRDLRQFNDWLGENVGETVLGTGDWGLGTGDWGLGTGDWGLGTEEREMGTEEKSSSVPRTIAPASWFARRDPKGTEGIFFVPSVPLRK